MKIVYFDCSAGISGDMCLGALVDAGAPLEKIARRLRGLPVTGYRLDARKVKRGMIAATKVDVNTIGGRAHAHDHRMWKDIQEVIKRSSLPDHMKERGLRIFRRLFVAEGKVHGKAYTRTYLHELGAVDCIVDIFGTLIGLDLLGVEKVCASSVNLGGGSVTTEHGKLPVPAPATAEIMKDVPVFASDVPFELTTPTGAAILRELTEDFGPLPFMELKQVGYGAGQRDIKGSPNALRCFLGVSEPRGETTDLPRVSVIETNIDDMNPQVYGYVMERLFSAGALDVYLTQVIMKKCRPGVVITVLCYEEMRAVLAELLLRETSTIGLRFHTVSRLVLERKIRKVKTEFGSLRVKEIRVDKKTVRYSPEYEDCRRIAEQFDIPLREVMRAVMKAIT